MFLEVSFVRVGSCDFVDRLLFPRKMYDPQNHTNYHERNQEEKFDIWQQFSSAWGSTS